MKKILCFLIFLPLVFQLRAQDDSLRISVQDSTLLQTMRSYLQLSSAQSNSLDSLIRTDSFQLQKIDKEHQSIARSSLPQAERDEKLTALREKKKSIKELRELNIKLVLTPEQIVLYDQKVKPGAPTVVHMGINHDRMNCVVCKP